MGCDIHIYIEYKFEKRDRWESFGGEIRGTRDYSLFGVLSKGVRTEQAFSFKQRGWPEDSGYECRKDNLYLISDRTDYDDRVVTMEKALEQVDYGQKIIYQNDKPTWVTNSDNHSHNWLTTDEYRTALEWYRKTYGFWYPEYEAVLAAMIQFERMDLKSRIVFWFDN